MSANRARAAISQSVSASTALPRSQPSSKRRSAPGQLAGARRATPDQAAERTQGVFLLGGQQAVTGRAAQPCGKRDGHPRAAVGPSPGRRAERGLGVVPQARRGLQPAQAAAGVLERAPVAAAGLQRQHRDGGVRVVGEAGRRVGERRRAHQREALAERDLDGFDHEPFDGGDHDRQLAAVVGDLLELGVGDAEALGVEDEVGGVGPDGAEEGLPARCRRARAGRRPGRGARDARGPVGRSGSAVSPRAADGYDGSRDSIPMRCAMKRPVSGR